MGVLATTDIFTLTGPNGSAINVASFVLADPGPDFGEQDLLKTIYSENPMMEGGVLAAEYVNVRRMNFPLRLASIGAYGGAAGLTSWLRTLSRPGATLDIQLTGDDSTAAVRFDVTAGRLELGQWNTQQFAQSDRIEGTLKLDVEPFGYWPTWILLASAASVGLPGSLTIPTGAAAGSVFGDVPALARLTILPTSPSTFGFGSWYIDTLEWSLHGQGASFRALWPAGSITPFGAGATLTADAFSISSQAAETLGAAAWSVVAGITFPASLAPAYAGRFRVWALAKSFPSQALPWYVSADSALGDVGNFTAAPMGSAAQIATLYPALASGGGTGGAWAAASPAYNLLDLGEMTLPPAQSASGGAVPFGIRLWTNCATTTLPVATPYLRFSAVWLQPLPMAGVYTRNLTYRSDSAGFWGAGDPVGLSLDSDAKRVLTVHSDASTPVREAFGDYRGVLPNIGASVTSLELGGFAKRFASPTTTVARMSPAYAAVSLQQRPRFAFVKGI